MSKQVFNEIPKLTVKGEALHQLAQAVQGAFSQNVLRLAANVADRETITVGPESFEVVQINTSTGATSTALANTSAADVTETITAHGLVVGSILRCENEYLRVKAVPSVNTVVLSRGYAGSTAASHANGTALFKKAAPALAAGKISLPVGATLTPAAAGPELATGFNALSTQGFKAVYTTGAFTISREANGKSVACTETLAGASNAWAAAATYGGIEKAEVKRAIAQRVPNATEVAIGNLSARFPFNPTFVRVTVQVSATRAAKAWGGTVAVSGDTVTLTNNATNDWAATDTVNIEVFGN
jgi:hypothetical protein